MKNDFVSKGRSVSDFKAHLVLTTKYRRKAFTGEMLTRLHEIFAALLVKWDCKIVEFNGRLGSREVEYNFMIILMLDRAGPF